MRIVGIVGSLRAAVEECPARAAELKDRVAGADALLLVAPEYNNTRLQGPRGRTHRRLARRVRHGAVAGGQLYVGNAAKVFDASGKLVDEAIRGRLRKYMEGFVGFVGG